MDATAVETFASSVRKARVAQSLSQEELAAKAGIDRTYVSGIERATRNPSLRTAERIAAALNIPLHELLTNNR